MGKKSKTKTGKQNDCPLTSTKYFRGSVLFVRQERTGNEQEKT